VSDDEEMTYLEEAAISRASVKEVGPWIGGTGSAVVELPVR
jgi:hypothetical protein